MALIDISPGSSPAEKAAARIRAESKRLHDLIVSSHQVIFGILWQTQDVDPQDILDAVGGPDSTTLFTNGSVLIDIALAQNPDALTEDQYVPPRAPTFNQDGTVTLAP